MRTALSYSAGPLFSIRSMYCRSSMEVCLITSLVTLTIPEILYDFNMLTMSAGTGVSVFAASIETSRNYIAQCVIDGTPMSATTQFSSDQPVCAAFGLPANTMHTIYVSVSVPPSERDTHFSGFCLDYLLIEPLPSMSLDDYNLFIPTFDPDTWFFGLSSVFFSIPGVDSVSLSGSPGWTYNGTNGYQTSKLGSQLNVTFTGFNSHAMNNVSPQMLTAIQVYVSGGMDTQPSEKKHHHKIPLQWMGVHLHSSSPYQIHLPYMYICSIHQQSKA